MQLTINIPKEFEEHFNNDRFEDSLKRMKFDIYDGMTDTEYHACGNYEFETVEMFIEAFKNAKIVR